MSKTADHLYGGDEASWALFNPPSDKITWHRACAALAEPRVVATVNGEPVVDVPILIERKGE